MMVVIMTPVIVVRHVPHFTGVHLLLFSGLAGAIVGLFIGNHAIRMILPYIRELLELPDIDSTKESANRMAGD